MWKEGSTMRSTISKPIIYEVVDNKEELALFANGLEGRPEKELLLEYPVVYIHNWKNSQEYDIYVGEANDVIKRTKQHYEQMNEEGKWQNNLVEKGAKLYIIGHNHFNKSLTLDIENRLMNYMLGVKCVRTIHNKRGNPQRKYYPVHERDAIFSRIWTSLRKKNPELFPLEKLVTDSTIFKASPLHDLTKEQEEIKLAIREKVELALEKSEMGQIIFVSGEAGTGKTVLNSSLFYDLCSLNEADNSRKISCHLLVNHDQQLTVYEQIAQKLNLGDGETVVNKPTSFINRYSEENTVDVVLIDEAHLLLTRGKQSYRGSNQLYDIQKRTKVVVVMFDKRQILKTEQFWENWMIEELEREAKQNNNYFVLERQLRIQGNKESVQWINQFTKNQIIEKIPKDPKYDIKIFDSPEELESEIKKKANCVETGLSRIIATFDWEYSGASKPKEHLKKYWEVSINGWKKPWNLQIDVEKKQKKINNKLAWAEQLHTIEEVGSTFTIQGFDLNYAAVILGPSVVYKDGKIAFNPDKSKNKNATTYRTLSDGTKLKFGKTLISNEVNVLMTRGVQGVYIYACDEELRNALKDAAN